MAYAILAILLVAALAAAYRFWQRSRELSRRYSPIADVHEELRRATEEAASLRARAKADAENLRGATLLEASRVQADSLRRLAAHEEQRAALSRDYAAARLLYDRLKREVSLVEENVENISIGLYKPRYTYPTSVDYKRELDHVFEAQKTLARAGQAALCGKTWEIQGDKRAGERMTKQYLKLILRAFNGECDAAIAKVTWNNITKMEERIRKACEAINDLGAVMDMKIMPDYLGLRLAELHLEHEYAEKKRAEQEEQRQIREQMREEERAIREAEKAMRDAEAEEQRNEAALEKARAELAQARGEALEQLQLKIKHLDAALHKAHEMKEKATSMSQLTRSGYVYVISNVGSFGDDIFKIGMTRRLDPMDRIWELGDASVPFDFDVHAMVYCEDAPSLENAFHSKFRSRALNLVNPRKEFFSVTIEEIEQVARERNLAIELTKIAEAKEHKQTLALRASSANVPTSNQAPVAELPATI